MSTILPKLGFSVKERLLKNFRRCGDAGTRTRYLIILKPNAGRKPEVLADYLGVHWATVYRAAKRFREGGERGLLEGRVNNGPDKLTKDSLRTLDRWARGSPQDYGHRRPTWTRELLQKTLVQLGFPKVHPAALSRALAGIRARRARPRPTAGCPWPNRRKARRLRKIRDLIEGLPKDEVAVYEDQVDIHLNPKIGYDWTGYGRQKEVRTPGKNVKRYLAGALGVRTGQLHYVEGENKDSRLFVNLLGKPYWHYEKAKRIHVILDNYGIHDGKPVAWASLEAKGKIKLQPLPPYCPNDNKTERVWEDLHAEVTRNHTCPDIETLMAEVRDFLQRRLQQALGRPTSPDHTPAGV